MCEPIIVSCHKKDPRSSDCLVCYSRNHCSKCHGHFEEDICNKCLFNIAELCNGYRLKRQESEETKKPKSKKNKRKKKNQIR